MSSVHPHATTFRSELLPQVLRIDAMTSLTMGLLLVVAHELLAPLLGLPATLLLASGLALFPCAALMWLAGRPPRPVAALVWVVIVGNAAWVLASLMLAFVWASPTLPGQLFLIAQALVVLCLAELEYVGLRRLRQSLA